MNILAQCSVYFFIDARVTFIGQRLNFLMDAKLLMKPTNANMTLVILTKVELQQLACVTVGKEKGRSDSAI